MSLFRGADFATAAPERGDTAGLEGADQGDRRRRCLLTREPKDPATMVRFVVGPEGLIVPDVEERLPGRGLWVTAERAAVERAVARRAFARAAHGPVRAPADLADLTEALLARRCLDLLGLARRAGQAVAGFEKVRELLAGGNAAVLLAARDGAEDGRRRLRAAAAGLPVVELFSAAEIGAAIGRDMAVHAALTRGRLAQRFLREAARLAGFRAPADEHTQPT